MPVSCWSCGSGRGGDGGCGTAVRGAAGEIGRVVGAGVVGPLPGAGSPGVSDREVGDLVDEVGAGGELAAPQQAASCPAIRAWARAETPAGGTEVAAATIRSRTPGPYTSGRPLRGRSGRAGMPPRANRRRQVRTVFTTQPSSAAIRWSGQPACASSTILARRTRACGADARRTIASSLALRRDPKTTTSGLAARAMTHLRVISDDRPRMPGTRSGLAAPRRDRRQ